MIVLASIFESFCFFPCNTKNIDGNYTKIIYKKIKMYLFITNCIHVTQGHDGFIAKATP